MCKELTLAFLFILLLLSSAASQKLNIIFSPPHLTQIEEGSSHLVHWTFDENNTLPFNQVHFDIRYNVLSPNVFAASSLSAHSIAFCAKINDSFTFEVTGKFLGYGEVEVILVGSDCHTGKPLNSTSYIYEVSVVRGYSRAKDVFKGFLVVAITIGYVNMGCQLDLGAIANVLRTPIGPTIGLFCQFFIMPLGAFIYGFLLLEDSSQRLGLFTIGCSPGGSMSNFWSLLFNGDVNLSVTMTFISTVAAIGMMPFWFYTLGSRLFHDGKATIPYGKLASSLVGFSIPLAIGILIRRWKPQWAAVSHKIIRPLTLMTVATTVLLGIYANTYIFLLFTWNIVLAGFGVSASGYILGSAIAWVCCLKKSQVVTVGIETAFRNGSIAYLVLLLSFPQPDADLTAVPVVAQLLLTSVPMWITLLVLKLWDCLSEDESHIQYEANARNKISSMNKPVVVGSEGPIRNTLQT